MAGCEDFEDRKLWSGIVHSGGGFQACIEFFPEKQDGKRFHSRLHEDKNETLAEGCCRGAREWSSVRMKPRATAGCWLPEEGRGNGQNGRWSRVILTERRSYMRRLAAAGSEEAQVLCQRNRATAVSFHAHEYTLVDSSKHSIRISFYIARDFFLSPKR